MWSRHFRLVRQLRKSVAMFFRRSEAMARGPIAQLAGDIRARRIHLQHVRDGIRKLHGRRLLFHLQQLNSDASDHVQNPGVFVDRAIPHPAQAPPVVRDE